MAQVRVMGAGLWSKSTASEERRGPRGAQGAGSTACLHPWGLGWVSVLSLAGPVGELGVKVVSYRGLETASTCMSMHPRPPTCMSTHERTPTHARPHSPGRWGRSRCGRGFADSRSGAAEPKLETEEPQGPGSATASTQESGCEAGTQAWGGEGEKGFLDLHPLRTIQGSPLGAKVSVILWMHIL